MAKVSLWGCSEKSKTELFLHKAGGSTGTGGADEQLGGGPGAAWEDAVTCQQLMNSHWVLCDT